MIFSIAHAGLLNVDAKLLRKRINNDVPIQCDLALIDDGQDSDI